MSRKPRDLRQAQGRPSPRHLDFLQKMGRKCKLFHVEHIVTPQWYVRQCHDGNPKMEPTNPGSHGYSIGERQNPHPNVAKKRDAAGHIGHNGQRGDASASEYMLEEAFANRHNSPSLRRGRGRLGHPRRQTPLLFVGRSHLAKLTLYSCGKGDLIQTLPRGGDIVYSQTDLSRLGTNPD